LALVFALAILLEDCTAQTNPIALPEARKAQAPSPGVVWHGTHCLAAAPSLVVRAIRTAAAAAAAVVVVVIVARIARERVVVAHVAR
jgi:acyl dehydratase